jgi:hypothetical protein
MAQLPITEEVSDLGCRSSKRKEFNPIDGPIYLQMLAQLWTFEAYFAGTSQESGGDQRS